MIEFKMSLMQEQYRREEYNLIRLMDREDEKRWAAEDEMVLEQRRTEEKASRQEGRERREEDRRGSDQMMQIMMVAMIGKGQPGVTDSSATEDK